MNEAAVVFNQTAKERSFGNSVRHKANGSAVSKLGNKRMSQKEIEEQHGECERYDMGGFMDREEFKKMPADLKAEYISKLLDKYDVTLNRVSKLVFHWGDDGLRAHMRNEKKLKECGYYVARANSGYAQLEQDYKEWCRKEESAKIIDLSEAKRRKDIIQNGEFVDYETYKSWSANDRIDYCNSLVLKYGVGINTIAKLLFEADPSTVSKSLKNACKDKGKEIQHGKLRGEKARQKNKEFENLVKAWKGEPVEEDNMVVAGPVIEGETVTTSASTKETTEAAEQISVELDKKIKEVSEKLKPKPVTLDDVFEALKRSKTEIPETDLKFEVNDLLYRDMNYSSSYTANGLDENELKALIELFRGKNVHVELTITTV